MTEQFKREEIQKFGEFEGRFVKSRQGLFECPDSEMETNTDKPGNNLSGLRAKCISLLRFKMRQRVNLSLSPTLVAKFDRAKGKVPRSLIISKLLEDFIKNKESATDVTSHMTRQRASASHPEDPGAQQWIQQRV
jgi:hypothetical protein